NARAQYRVETARWVEAKVYAGSLKPELEQYAGAIGVLSRAKPVTLFDSRLKNQEDKKALVVVLENSDIVIPMTSMVDPEAERMRLQKEITQSEAEVTRLEARLGNSDFLTKAPKPVIDRERQKLQALTDKLRRLQQQITRL
ncbi:valine--tRNA ligase, partial [Chloroflexota bacterium]